MEGGNGRFKKLRWGIDSGAGKKESSEAAGLAGKLGMR